jgi:hypothetical protein
MPHKNKLREVRKSERKSSVCCFLRQQLSTQSCHSYGALRILKHSVRAVFVWIMHFAKIPTHSHSTRVTCRITDGNPNKGDCDKVPTGPGCRPHVGYDHYRGRWWVCVNTLSGQPITGWPVWVKETRVLYRNIFPSRFYFPANSIVVSFILLKPRLNNATLIDFACILPSPLHGTNKQSKFIQNS